MMMTTQEILECLGIKPAAEVKTKHVDVIRLLSNPNNNQRDFLVRPSDGTKVKIRTLRNKYVVICYVYLPLSYDSSEYDQCRKIIKAYPELVVRAGEAFELVIVANTNNEADFNEFFSGFPGLTIPFKDSDSGALAGTSIYACLGLDLTQPRPAVGMILDPNHMVVQDDYCGDCFRGYGAAFYPFTYDKVKTLVEKQSALHSRLDICEYYLNNDCRILPPPPVSLADVLNCETCHILKRWTGRRYEEISVLELSKKKCVGVYLCIDGVVMSELASMYRQCRANHLEFEIVMVCLPEIFETPALEDVEAIRQWSSEFGDSTSFWLFPCSHETSLQLEGLCNHRTWRDNLIIVRPDDKFWDKFGKSILRSGGIASYPFTTESILDRMTSSLYSLLGGDYQTLTKLPYTYNNNNDLDHHSTCSDIVAHLRDKNVLVYFDYPKDLETDFLNLVQNATNCVPDLEVVFAPVGPHDVLDLTNSTGEMSGWLMLPPKLANVAVQQLFTQTEFRMTSTTTIVAFGKDGRIRSRRAQDYLTHPHQIGPLFDNDMSHKEFDYLHKRVQEHAREVYETFEDDEMVY